MICETDSWLGSAKKVRKQRPCLADMRAINQQGFSLPQHQEEVKLADRLADPFVFIPVG
jgi:hypothetical protein